MVEGRGFGRRLVSAAAAVALRLARAARRHWRLAAALGLAVIATAAWIRLGPLPPGLLALDEKPSLVILDRHGERLYEARSDAGTRSERLSAAAVPHTLASATLAAEDVRFRSHWGLDPIAIGRAALRDLRAGQIVEGGSTITQQVAKLLIARRSGAGPRRGWLAKADEAIVALRLEHRLTKDEILALYVNLAPYGNQIEGAARAAQAYFGRRLDTLTPAEAAFLASLPRAPGRFNPWRDGTAAQARTRRVLATMADRGWLAPQDYAVARAERLSLTHEAGGALAPHFVGGVLTDLGDRRPRIVGTTLDAPLQRTVEGIIAAHRDVLRAHHAENVAVAVLDNRTGDWLAWEGSGNYFDRDHGGTIDGVTAPRQPGSALKPFTYAAAFELGVDPGTVLADVPSQFPTDAPGVLYAPRNYDGQFRGPLLARAALAGSENVPAVALASRIGVPTVARLLRRTGFTSLGLNAAHYGLGLTLGDAEVRLDELVAGYAMFARGGTSVRPRRILRLDAQDVSADEGEERLVSARTAFWISDILSDDQARAYVFGRGGSLEFPFSVADKTGTSTAYRDNWAVGYTREVTVGVWVGNFDRTPLRDSSGVTGAGPIFHDVMIAAVERARGNVPIDDRAAVVAPTGDTRRVQICAVSGLLAGAACPAHLTEWVAAGTPRERCTWHHDSDEGLVTIWPEPFRAWARDNGLLAQPQDGAAGLQTGGARTLAQHGAAGLQPDGSTLTIVEPLAGAVYLYDPTLHREFQTLGLRAAGAAPGVLEWLVDGTAFGRATPDDDLRWPLARGTHDIVVRDAAGRTASARVVVR